MKKTTTTLASVLLCLGPGIVLADAHEEAATIPNIVPVETWTCNFNDGKSMTDLNTVVGEWNDWLDEEQVADYFAAVLTPAYYGEVMFEVGWLGAWKDGNAMGTGTDMWVNEGGELAAKFFEVINCDSHTNFASMNIKRPGEDEEGDKTFVLSFANCSAKEGRNFDDVMAGMNAWAEHQAANGFQNSTWMMFPVYGESNTGYDFKFVEGHDDHAGLGADYELMGNGGHWRKNSEIMDDLLDCDIARVYNATAVREMASEDEDG